MNNALTMWVVYKSPIDYPGKYVARRWEVKSGGKVTTTKDLILAGELGEIHGHLPVGLVKLALFPSDDPVIIEAWV